MFQFVIDGKAHGHESMTVAPALLKGLCRIKPTCKPITLTALTPGRIDNATRRVSGSALNLWDNALLWDNDLMSGSSDSGEWKSEGDLCPATI